MHPLMAFEGISAPVSGFGTGDAPWSEDPTHGSLDEDDAIALAGFLAGFTGTPDRSFFAVWEGYGQFSPGGMSVLSYPGGSKALSPPDEVLTAGRIKGIKRDYLLYTGPLSAIGSFFVDFWHRLTEHLVAGGPRVVRCYGYRLGHHLRWRRCRLH